MLDGRVITWEVVFEPEPTEERSPALSEPAQSRLGPAPSVDAAALNQSSGPRPHRSQPRRG
jgi:hypothetical protein